jgi:hypothetical protein
MFANKENAVRRANRYDIAGHMLTIQEIAGLSGRSAAAIKSRLHRGMSAWDAAFGTARTGPDRLTGEVRSATMDGNILSANGLVTRLRSIGVVIHRRNATCMLSKFWKKGMLRRVAHGMYAAPLSAEKEP